jgi:hypothetical protein
MIIIAPYAQKLRNNKENPKNYPYWKELIAMIDELIIQVGVDGRLLMIGVLRERGSDRTFHVETI